METIWAIATIVPALVDGAIVTLKLCALATILGLALAGAIVAVRLNGGRIARRAVAAYVAVMRGLPFLILIFIIYFGLPPLVGTRIPAFEAGVVALAMNGAAFMSEVLRGAIAKIPPGQFEAARALGIPAWLTWWRVIVPQLVPIALPALIGEIGFLVKASPLLSLITVVELTRRAQQIVQQTYDPLTPLLAAALIYFILIGSLSVLAAMLERRSAPAAR